MSISPRIIEKKVIDLEKHVQLLQTSDQYLTVAQVQQILQISKNSAYDLFNMPSFPGRKIRGVGMRVRASKLYEFIDKQL